jgi:hypothetical protein
MEVIYGNIHVNRSICIDNIDGWKRSFYKGVIIPSTCNIFLGTTLKENNML